MKTEIAPTGSPNERAETVMRALELLRVGEVVALPTETVYGLAADALSAAAVVKIFETKERPRFDPLIVHLPERDWLEKLTLPESETQSLVEALTTQFWPGPLTIVLPRREIVPSIATAGLPTVAVRMSAHPVFTEIVRAFGKPLAAPSANRFGRISPTSAADVAEELSGRIPLVVDGGATQHGIESTVIAPRSGGIEILRSGPITREELAHFGAVRMGISGAAESPGQLPAHYRPSTPLLLTDNITTVTVPQGKRYGALLWNEHAPNESFVETRRLSTTNNLREAASNLFRQLRELDHADVDLILAEAVPESGLGVAIMDRLRRAAHS
ncbi:MAG: L-threonylcarbamoyladenylate synthase [Verrucomicrobiota bacterium]|nr:L-threonylcarbamoyladenylate synthase [Verrucomicrobiota bacterium]